MSESKKRNKSYYTQPKKQCTGRQLLDIGMKGFLITCNFMEKQAVREAYNVLSEYKQLIYTETTESDVVAAEPDDAEIDFDKLINSQVEAMQSEGGGSGSTTTLQRFQAVDTKTTNCIFIRSPASIRRPDEILSRLLADVSASGNAKSRSILKIFPVFGTCRAIEEKIEKLVEDLVTEYFPDGTLRTYAILYKVRCNSLGREHILSSVGRAVHCASPSSRVDLKDPDYVVSIDVLNKFACVSFMKDFYKLKKYNLQELAVKTDNQEPRAKNETETAGLECMSEKAEDGKAGNENNSEGGAGLPEPDSENVCESSDLHPTDLVDVVRDKEQSVSDLPAAVGAAAKTAIVESDVSTADVNLTAKF